MRPPAPCTGRVLKNEFSENGDGEKLKSCNDLIRLPDTPRRESTENLILLLYLLERLWISSPTSPQPEISSIALFRRPAHYLTALPTAIGD